jgi:FKBP-type peptidyl-prolyl cis-trans isomerase
MKRLLIIPLFLIPVILTAQKTKIKEPVKAPASVVTLSNATDSSHYILGAYIGQYLRANNLTISNPSLFSKGLDDVLSGKPMLVPADSIPRRMGEYLSKMAVERSKLLEKQLFDAVKGQPGVGTLPNGVCYVIAKAGTGLRPQPSDTVSFHLKGYLPDGTLFEDTYTKNTPLKAIPSNLIPGLREAILIMPAGSVWRIYIPSALAYGEKGVPGIIPPFSALVFDIELLSIKK